MGRAKRVQATATASDEDDSLTHGFCLLGAIEFGEWPAWHGPREAPELRRRVETLAILFDIIPRAELRKLDMILECWATRFPERQPVPLEQLRQVGRSIIHSSLPETSLQAGASELFTSQRAESTVVGLPAGSEMSSAAPSESESAHWLDAALTQWKNRVTGDRRWTHLPAIVPGEPPGRIDEIYVELYAVSDDGVSEDLNAASERATRVSRRLLAERQPIVGVATLVARTLERCIVVGEPGSGKSTLIQWLAHAIYRGVIPDYDHALVVKLSAYAMALQDRPSLTLLDFFFGLLTPGNADWQPVIGLLRRLAAERRRHLLLLDGWDEVPLPLRESVREQILAEGRFFVTIVTSRPSGLPRELRDNGRVELYQIAGLTPRATEELTRNLLRRMDRFELLNPILRRLRDERDLREMAVNPFLLGLLVRVLARTVGEAAPRSLADVYDQIAAWIQEQHNRLMAETGPLTADHLAVLGRLSYGLLYGTELPHYVFRGREINASLAGQGISQEPIHRSRFINRTDPDFDEYCFLHATLQEYFAATYAAKLSPDGLDGFLEESFRSASRLVVLEFAAGIDEVAEQCRRKAVGWFRSRDRFHHTLLRLARLLAAGRWRADDADGLGKAVRHELWQIIENKEHAVLTTAAMHAFAELDPVDLIHRASKVKTLDFLHLGNILNSVPRSLVGPETLEGLLEGQWRNFANLVVVKATTDEDFAAVRKAIQDGSSDPEARTAAVRIAGMSRDAGSVPALLEMLRPDFPNPELRKDAVDSLGRIGGRQAVEALVGLLVSDGQTEALAGHASAALSMLGSAALDPAGRDRLLRNIAASDPASGHLADTLYALRDYPLRDGAEVVADLAGRSDLAASLRVAAVQAVASAIDMGVVEHLVSAANREHDQEVSHAICKLAMERSVKLPDEWLEQQITGDTSDAKRTLCLATYLLQLARVPSARRVRCQAFVHRLVAAALAPGAPGRLASCLSRALTQPEPTTEPILAQETLGLARGMLDAFVALHRPSEVDQLVLAANIVRHFPNSDVGGIFRPVLDTALRFSGSTAGESERQEWDRLAGFVVALLGALAPGELLRYPPNCTIVENALCEVSVRRGWFVFADRITDAEGRPIACVERTDESAPEGTGRKDGQQSQASAQPEALSGDSQPDGSIVRTNERAPASQDHPGIERLGEAAADILDALRGFRRIGQVCREKGNAGTMSIKRIGAVLAESDTKVRDDMTAVSSFFRKYFRDFESLDVPNDDDEDLPPAEAERRKLFERVQGRTFRIYTLGWRAWELTCRYLDRIAPLPPRNG